MKAIILTGYTSGLGSAIHDNLISSISKDKLIFIGRGDVRSTINNKKLYLKVDLSNLADVALIKMDKYLQDVSEVAFINNAGTVKPICSINDMKMRDFSQATAVNYMSPVILINKFKQSVEKMNIINISSGAALKPISYWSTYCSTKSAMRMYLDVVALEKDISVQHYDPGVMDTGMQKEIREKSNKYTELKIFEEMSKNKMLKDPSYVAEEICRMIV